MKRSEIKWLLFLFVRQETRRTLSHFFTLFVFASAQQDTSESFSAILPASQSVSHAFYIIQFCIMLRLLQRMDTANFGCTTNDNCDKKYGLNRDLNPGPLAPKARIIPLDHWALLYSWWQVEETKPGLLHSPCQNFYTCAYESLYSSVAERWSCKPKVMSSILIGGNFFVELQLFQSFPIVRHTKDLLFSSEMCKHNPFSILCCSPADLFFPICL